MKTAFTLMVLFVLLLTGCGTVTPQGVVLHTADPAVGILIPVATVVVEVIPEEEVGEVLPDPLPEPPCDFIVDGECQPIKGNISKSGEKIYHVPDGASYGQVKIDEAAGEAFFRTEEEAVAAGWRKALR